MGSDQWRNTGKDGSMKIELRVERLEARVPDDTEKVDRIELVDPIGGVPTAVSSFENGRWTDFDMGFRR